MEWCCDIQYLDDAKKPKVAFDVSRDRLVSDAQRRWIEHMNRVQDETAPWFI